ncbi:hypothetical protein D3C72_1886250 [compost metagenome]
MVHNPALRPDCSSRGSPLTSTQPSRRSMSRAIKACQHASGAGQGLIVASCCRGCEGLIHCGRPIAKAWLVEGGSSSSQAQGICWRCKLCRLSRAPGVTSA